MATRPRVSEAEALELYRVSLQNAKSQPEIAAELAELGYDESKIQEGEELLTSTRQVYDKNKTEDDESADAYSKLESKRRELTLVYAKHRKLAKVVFKKDPVTLARLSIDGSMPNAYIRWVEMVRKFYTETTSDPDLQSKLARLNLSAESLTQANTLLGELESARTIYLKEKGESQDATQAKDLAFARMDDWMSEFYAVAKIALEDNPQLLESLGRFVKS